MAGESISELQDVPIETLQTESKEQKQTARRVKAVWQLQQMWTSIWGRRKGQKTQSSQCWLNNPPSRPLTLSIHRPRKQRTLGRRRKGFRKLKMKSPKRRQHSEIFKVLRRAGVAQWVKALGTKADELSLIPETHKMEERWLLKAALCSPRLHYCATLGHTGEPAEMRA